MVTMHKFYVILLFFIILLFSSCSSSSKNESDNINSRPTVNSQNIKNERDIFTDTKNTSDFNTTQKQNQDTDKYYSIDRIDFSDEDQESILYICDDICKHLKKLYRYNNIIQYESLKKYLKYSIANSAFDFVPDNTDLYFSLQSLNIESQHAVVTGLLKDSTGAYGECIIILSNNEGKILLNDIAVDTKGSSDIIYRPDFFHSPYPDFWLEYSNYSQIADQIFNK